MEVSMSDTNRTVHEKEARIGIEALNEALYWWNQYASYFEKVMNGPAELEKGLTWLTVQGHRRALV